MFYLLDVVRSVLNLIVMRSNKVLEREREKEKAALSLKLSFQSK